MMQTIINKLKNHNLFVLPDVMTAKKDSHDEKSSCTSRRTCRKTDKAGSQGPRGTSKLPSVVCTLGCFATTTKSTIVRTNKSPDRTNVAGECFSRP